MAAGRYTHGTPGFVFYGIDNDTGEYMEPIAPIAPIDDVTGEVIPAEHIGIQDGMVKDRRPSQGSWEKSWRNELYLGLITYDPALGVQQRACGEYDD